MRKQNRNSKLLKYRAIIRHVNQIRNFFAQMLSVYETLNRGLQRQKQRQPLNTLASNVLLIYKTKKSAVAIESEGERVLMVTG